MSAIVTGRQIGAVGFEEFDDARHHETHHEAEHAGNDDDKHDMGPSARLLTMRWRMLVFPGHVTHEMRERRIRVQLAALFAHGDQRRIQIPEDLGMLRRGTSRSAACRRKRR